MTTATGNFNTPKASEIFSPGWEGEDFGERSADLNLGDLCVLLCGSLFPPVVGDLAQKIPKTRAPQE